MCDATYNITINRSGVNIGNQTSPIEYDPEANNILLNARIKLKNHYKRKNAYMRSLLKQKNLKDNDLPINEYFIEFKFKKIPKIRKRLGEDICLNQIFLKKEGNRTNEEENQTILLIGNSGYGKTTVCKKIAYDWASNENSEHYLSRFDFAVIIDLRKYGKRNLTEIIMDTIFDRVKKEKRPNLSQYKKNVLVMIDEYDQFSDAETIQTFLNFESVEISTKITTLLTTRPQNVNSIIQHIDLQILIEGFSEEMQEEYIRLVFEDKPSSCSVLLMDHLKENAFRKGIAECPLMLNIICSLYQSEGVKLIKKLTDLYSRMLIQMIKHSSIKHKATDLSFGLTNIKYDHEVRLLAKLAEEFPHPRNSKIALTSTSLNNYFPDKTDKQFILGLQLLYDYSIYEIQHYDMIHESFLEFLYALFIRKNSNWELPYFSNYTLLFIMGLYNVEKLSDIPLEPSKIEEVDINFPEKLRMETNNDNLQLLCDKLKSLNLIGDEISDEFKRTLTLP